MQKQKAIFNWSGGKDSALALYTIQKEAQFEISTLVTTVNSAFDRISMHGVRRELLMAQAQTLNLPVKEILLPAQPSMSDYNSIMRDALVPFQKAGVTHSIFGDIFLEDLRRYREEKLAEVGFEGVFPLWKKDTRETVMDFIKLGFKTKVVCVKSEVLSEDFTGRTIDENFLADLPDNVDPCGENGEFHTFVYDGPNFREEIPIQIGEKVFRAYPAPQTSEDTCLTKEEKPSKEMGFWFCDLILKSKRSAL